MAFKNGWRYHSNLDKDMENSWKVLLAQLEEEGYEDVFVADIVRSNDLLHVTAYDAIEAVDGMDVDFGGLEAGVYEPGVHEVPALDYAEKVEKVADRKDKKTWEIGLEDYVTDVIEAIERQT